MVLYCMSSDHVPRGSMLRLVLKCHLVQLQYYFYIPPVYVVLCVQ